MRICCTWEFLVVLTHLSSYIWNRTPESPRSQITSSIFPIFKWHYHPPSCSSQIPGGHPWFSPHFSLPLILFSTHTENVATCVHVFATTKLKPYSHPPQDHCSGLPSGIFSFFPSLICLKFNLHSVAGMMLTIIIRLSFHNLEPFTNVPLYLK